MRVVNRLNRVILAREKKRALELEQIIALNREHRVTIDGE